MTAPTRVKFYALPLIYLGTLLLLLLAAWLLLAGTQELRTPADSARFGMTIVPLLAWLQLSLAVFFPAVLAAVNVAQEKDRRTLILLLLTHLRNSELVLGRLLATLLPLAVALAATVPLFMLLRGFGGFSLYQLLVMLGIQALTALLTASLGSLLALWREKTFLSLALTLLTIGIWLGFWSAVASGLLGESWRGYSTADWAATFSPFAALGQSLQPLGLERQPWPYVGSPVWAYVAFAATGTLVLNGIAIWRLRVWNPPREIVPANLKETTTPDQTASPRDIHAAPGKTRPVWANPILWREVRTWAYGKKILWVKAVYGMVFAAVVWALATRAGGMAPTRETLAVMLGPLLMLSLILINALAVNSLSNEKDLGALDLLLVTDLSPREFIYGKLLGIAYGAKELILLPLALIAGLWLTGWCNTASLIYLSLGLLTLVSFAAMLGVHVGLTYDNSRTAIAVSLGTIFFLLVGIGICMRILIAFGNTSLEIQLVAFSAVMAGGGVGMYAALGLRNPSPAIALASCLCPIGTFLLFMFFLSGGVVHVFLLTVGIYGFGTLAMLIPAIDAFDVATGRTTE
ncbi:MAG: hypothetical protein SFX18_17875 [Pirellulales bacterium]|nr:hypothetical protein [Pirellulales bacterium]